jgi:hypothetical protein
MQLASRTYRKPDMSVQNVTMYVDGTNGSDSGDGSAAKPFKTIGKAIAQIPQVVNHGYTINIAFGTYNETLNMSGLIGSGSITFNGDVNVSSNVTVSGDTVLVTCSVPIFINGINFTSTNLPLVVARCMFVGLDKCNIVSVAAGSTATSFLETFGRITNSTISNKFHCVNVDIGAQVTLINNSGTGNTNYVNALSGAVYTSGTKPIGAMIGTSGVINPWGDNTRANRAMASAWNSAGLTMTNASTFYKMPFDTKSWDNLNEYDTTNKRYVASKTGQILVNCTVSLSSAPANARVVMSIYKNGSQYIQIGGVQLGSSASDEVINGSGTVQVAAGDYLEIYLWSSIASTLTYGNNGQTGFVEYQQIA